MVGFVQIISFGLVCGFATLLLFAAVTDYRHYLITNRTVAAVVALFALFFAAQFALPAEARLIASPWNHLWKALPLAIVVFAGATALFAAGLMGGGDVKLLAAVTLWAGPNWTAAFLLTTAVAGGIVTLGVLVRTRLAAAKTAAPTAEAASLIVNPLGSKIHAPKVPYGLGICVGGLVVAYALASRTAIFV